MIEKYYDFSRVGNPDSVGQHFMIDKSIIKFIVNSANLKESDTVLEIGYGKGALTYELIRHSHVIAIDIVYTDLNSDSKNLHVIPGNILDKWGEIKSEFDYNKIVSNIPYNIAEPLMKLMLKTEFELCVITVGKKFSEIISRQDTRLGILVHKLMEVRALKTVPKNAFIPQPKVTSVIMKLKRIPRSKLKPLGRLYRDLIFLENKKIKNALERIMEYETSIRKITKRALTELLKYNKMTKICDKKIYELTNEEFLQLDRFLEKLF